MIKKFKLYIMLVAVALSSVSCLDKMPEDGIPFDESLQTVSDINLAVIGIYDAFRSKYLYSGNLTLLPDIQTDLVYGVNGNTNVYGDIWRWKEIKPTNTDIEAVYGALYDVINRCNFMLDRADAVRKKTTDDKELDKLDQCCGEAYFARALAYSELVKLFCKAYESDEDAAGQLGVILSEHYLGDETMRRASLKDSYQFILDDLDRAAELLELEEDFDTDTQGTLYDSIYFNEYTVHALRARVLLYMKRWDEAIKYATKVIDSGYYYLSSCTRAATSNASYYKYMWTNDFSTEAIWKVRFTLQTCDKTLCKTSYQIWIFTKTFFCSSPSWIRHNIHHGTQRIVNSHLFHIFCYRFRILIYQLRIPRTSHTKLKKAKKFEEVNRLNEIGRAHV